MTDNRIDKVEEILRKRITRAVVYYRTEGQKGIDIEVGRAKSAIYDIVKKAIGEKITTKNYLNFHTDLWSSDKYPVYNQAISQAHKRVDKEFGKERK